MKQKLFTILAFVLFSFSINAQTLIHTVDFETATGYTTSVSEFSDAGGDYFIRTDGTDIGSWMEFTNIQGTSYFAAQDTDGDGEPANLTLDITGIDITGYSSLELRVYLAEDQSSDGTEDWDADTYVHFTASIDGGSSQNLIWVAGQNATNTEPLIDTDFDGIGDGAAITPDFTQYTQSIGGTGSLLNIAVEFNNLDAGDEDIAIDHIEVYGVTGGVVAPSIVNIVENPDIQYPTDAVTVSADITDDGTITAATLSWGLATGVYNQGTINMTVGTAPNYVADTDIPAQAVGVTVYYIIAATDDETNLTTTDEQSYTVVAATGNDVANIAALRASAQDGTEFTLTGEAILTFQQSYRGQKWIEDATGAILIDDNSGNITTVYSQYDGITGITGTVSSYNDVTQFIPTMDPGTASSTANTITPQSVDIATLIANIYDYESELVTISNATFDEADGSLVFANGTNYSLTDNSGTFNLRTNFYDVDYIGTVIPDEAHITGLVGNYQGDAQVYARDLADINTTVAIDELGIIFKIYPNPSNGVFTVNVENNFNLEVFDITGKVITTRTLTGNTTLELNTAGVYFLRFSNEKGSVTERVIVQ